MSVVCSRCAKENPEENRFCSRCGLELAGQGTPVSQVIDENTVYCYKHKNEPTALRCGKCDKPICHKCVVLGPAGTRCRDCARNNVTVRPMGIFSDLRLGVGRMFRGPYVFWIWIMIFTCGGGFVRGCYFMNEPRPPIDQRYEDPESQPEPSPKDLKNSI